MVLGQPLPGSVCCRYLSLVGACWRHWGAVLTACWLTPSIGVAFTTANPAAGYVKIQLYVPFYWRPGDSHADPVLRALLESAIAEFDVDLYTANLVRKLWPSPAPFTPVRSIKALSRIPSLLHVIQAGLPLLARTGGSDDNVPPLHSRRLFRLVNEHSGSPSAVQYGRHM